MRRCGYLFICLLIFIKVYSRSNSDTLFAKQLLPYGRTQLTADHQLELISSAVHFGFSFTGKECKIFASLANWQDHNYLQYEIDGVYQKRIKVIKGGEQSITLTATTDGKHTVWIYKATEATSGPIFISKIAGRNIKALQNSKAPLIEFIGNSITCGADADASEIACGKGEYLDYHNAYYAYGPRVARKLGVNFMLSSVSGIGIYRTWNQDHPSMPLVYEKTDFQEQSARLWNFKSYTPKFVSIALGTNDLSDGDGKSPRAPFDSARFVTDYVQFVQLVKSKYQRAQIVLLSSPMVNGDRRILLQNCLTAIKTQVDKLYPSSKPIALYFFKAMQPRGCSYHPSVEDHAILAEELTPFFRELLK